MAKIESGGGHKVTGNTGGQDVKVSPEDAKAFDKLDNNNDGKLSHSEYQKSAIGDDVSFDRAAKLVSKEGRDPTVDLSDYAKARQIAASQAHKTPAKGAGEGVGKFDASQVRKEVSERTPGFLKAAKQFFAAADKDKSGTLSGAEYAQSALSKKISFGEASKIASKGGEVNYSDFLGGLAVERHLPVKAKTAAGAVGITDPKAIKDIQSGGRVEPKFRDAKPVSDANKAEHLENKKKLIDTLKSLGITDPREQAIYINAAATEAEKLNGSPHLGDNKTGEGFNFGIYNMNTGQIADLKIELKQLDERDRAAFVAEWNAKHTPNPANEATLKQMAWSNVKEDTALFRAAIKEFGYDYMMAQHRGGSTSVTDYKNGFKVPQPVNYPKPETWNRSDEPCPTPAQWDARIEKLTGVKVQNGMHPDQYGAKNFIEIMKARTQAMGQSGGATSLQSSGGAAGLLKGELRFSEPIPYV